MARLYIFLLTFGMVVCGLISTAWAQKLRRPYAPAIAFNYGFDNQSGAGCKDWSCGTHCYDGHTGTDHPLGLGTEVVAGAGGVVSAVSNGCANYGYKGNTCGGGCGNYVQISHDDGTVALYCHMKLNSIVVSKNRRVSCGQKLGQSASSGSSTGPHLHVTWIKGGVRRDSFRGSCTSSPGCWNQQNGYRSAVGTACASTCHATTEVCDGKDNDCDGKIDEGVKNACGKCGAVPKEVCDGKDNDCDGKIDEGVKNACGKCGAVPREVCDGEDNDCDGQIDEGVKNACGGCGAVPTEVCDGKDNDCDGQVDEGDLCEVEWLNSAFGVYASARSSDINGDGRADVCGRGGAGLWCHLSNGRGFTLDPRSQVVPMASADEWKEAQHYATIRMGDVDGDGLADVCGRGVGGVVCWASDGEQGWTRFEGPALSNDSGWSAPQHYTTLRLADINGDGRDDLCARAARGLLCWPSTGRGFGEALDGPLWSNDNGFGAAKYYGTLRFGDINGDGKDDACIRHNGAYVCAPSTGEGFAEPIQVAEWSNAEGWGELRHWATISLADLDGDGVSDVCARRPDGELGCQLSEGGRFTQWRRAATLAGDRGWDDVSNWATIRAGEVNGAPGDELCARANAGVRCWAWDGAAFVGLDGPAWSDDAGWGEESRYATLRMGDINGDGGEDLCARAQGGWECYTTGAGGFSLSAEPTLEEFKSDGWSKAQHWTTLQMGGPRCAPERCNGRDDDCDGVVDDDPVEDGQLCNPVDGAPCQLGLTICDGGVVRCEAMDALREGCDPDLGMMGGDLGGWGAADMEGVRPERPSVVATGELGCGCELAPGGAPGSLGWALCALVGALSWRRRRVGSRELTK